MKQTDNLEARAEAWYKAEERKRLSAFLDNEGRPLFDEETIATASASKARSLAPRIAAFARSLAPSGAVVEAGNLCAAMLRGLGNGNYPGSMYFGSDIRGDALERSEAWDLAVAASPSVEPTVEEQVENITPKVMPMEEVEKMLKEIMDAREAVRNSPEGMVWATPLESIKFFAAKYGLTLSPNLTKNI